MSPSDTRGSPVSSLAPALAGNPRLREAFERINSQWFPVNPKLLEEVQARLQSGDYDENRKLLVADLRRDMSLFGYCVRSITRALKERAGAISALPQPTELFHVATLEELHAALTVTSADISAHCFQDISQLQGLRLEQSVVSASVAEVLSELNALDPNQAYTTGLFRHLGLTLIAWNYPHVYERVLLSLEPGISLDRALGSILGFSPTLLGVAVAQEWGFPLEMRFALGDSSLQKNGASPLVAQRGMALRKICEVGEALARASDPEHYPSAHADWDTARVELERALGPTWLKKLQEKISDNCGAYFEAMPELFRFNKQVQHYGLLQESDSAELLQKNVYVKYCSTAVNERIKELYSQIDNSNISVDNIQLLVKEIIPLAGFDRGCIYLIDTASYSLVPRLAVGEVVIDKLSSVKYFSVLATHNPISKAYQSVTPVSGESNLLGEPPRHFIAGIIGKTQTAGVLYLEPSRDLLSSQRENPLATFKALRQALSDCLNLY